MAALTRSGIPIIITHMIIISGIQHTNNQHTITEVGNDDGGWCSGL
jgi:hypothetical protein